MFFRYIFISSDLSKNISEDINSTVNECSDAIEEYINSLVNNGSEKSHDISSLIDEDGIMLSTSFDESDYINHQEIIKALNENGMQCELVSIDGSKSDMGASGAISNFIIFVLASIQSGVTWDIIKGMISKIPDIDINKFKFIDNIGFRKMRKTVAERIQVDPMNLALINFDKGYKRNKIRIVLSCNRKKYEVICDSSYNIQKLKVID